MVVRKNKPAPAAANDSVSAEGTTITAVRHFEDGQPSTSGETIEVRNFVTKPATVSVNLGNVLGDYGNGKIGVMVTVPCYTEEMDDALKHALTKAKSYMDILAEEVGAGATASEEPDEEEEAEEADTDESEEEEISEEDIEAMKRPDLEEFVTENEIEVDPSEYAKNAKGLKEFKAAVIEALFSEEEEAEEEEEEEEEEEADEEEEEFDVETADRDALIEYIEENELEVDPDDFKDNAVGLKKLRKAVQEASLVVEGEEDEEEEDEEEGEVVTKEDLEAMDEDELKSLFKENGLKWLSGPWNAAKKKKLIKIVLDAQDAE